MQSSTNGVCFSHKTSRNDPALPENKSNPIILADNVKHINNLMPVIDSRCRTKTLTPIWCVCKLMTTEGAITWNDGKPWLGVHSTSLQLMRSTRLKILMNIYLPQERWKLAHPWDILYLKTSLINILQPSCKCTAARTKSKRSTELRVSKNVNNLNCRVLELESHFSKVNSKTGYLLQHLDTTTEAQELKASQTY